jgi:hypothetical protein
VVEDNPYYPYIINIVDQGSILRRFYYLTSGPQWSNRHDARAASPSQRSLGLGTAKKRAGS